MVISSMVDPKRVRTFLRPGSDWDPSFGLAAMVAAAVALVATCLEQRMRGMPCLAAGPFQVTQRDVTHAWPRGGVIFGLGLGL